MNIIFFHPGWFVWCSCAKFPLGCPESAWIGSGWDGIHFPHSQSCAPLVAGKVFLTHSVWPLLSRAGTASGLSLQELPLTNRLGVGRIWGGDNTRRADPKWQNAVKAKRKKEVRGVCFHNICLPEQPLCVLKLCFLERGCTLCADGK